MYVYPYIPFQECFEIVRASLLPGILKTLEHNKALSKPIKLFEISDVVLLDDTSDVGARNERRFAAVYVEKRGGGGGGHSCVLCAVCCVLWASVCVFTLHVGSFPY